MTGDASPPPEAPDNVPGPFAGLRNKWWLLVLGGTGFILVAMVALSQAFIDTTTLVTVIVIGTCLLFGGGLEIGSAFSAGRWQSFLMHLLIGILYIVVGVLVLEHPVQAAAGLTLMIAASLLVGGTFRIVVALRERFAGWGWVLLSGVVSMVLGVMIWRRWPQDTLWVIGMFVGIEMLFAGWSWVMLGMFLRAAPKQP
jgi:uncharacterized membrane protein HdeD (DUF308 family)